MLPRGSIDAVSRGVRERRGAITVKQFKRLRLNRGSWWLALTLAISFSLAACGGDEENEDPGNTGGNIASPVNKALSVASPQPGSVARGNLPQDGDTETVTIKNGKLDPDNVESQAGLPFVLLVEGDGTEHTLEIEGIVNSQQIAANGSTEVSFAVPQQDTGTARILLDGQEAGTFSVQNVGGGIND